MPSVHSWEEVPSQGDCVRYDHVFLHIGLVLHLLLTSLPQRVGTKLEMEKLEEKHCGEEITDDEADENVPLPPAKKRTFMQIDIHTVCIYQHTDKL